MQPKLTEEWFISMRVSASEAQQLFLRTRHVLSMRKLQSFDGLGHFLDEVLPDEAQRVTHIAAAVRIPSETLSRLRASRLDPLSLAPEPLALLGCVLGLAGEQFEELIVQDHTRFLPRSQGATARGELEARGEALERLRACWARTSADSAADL